MTGKLFWMNRPPILTSCGGTVYTTTHTRRSWMTFSADSPGEGKLAPRVTTARRVLGLPTALPGSCTIDKACSGVIADAASEGAGIRVASSEPRSRVTPCGGITAGRTSSVDCEASAVDEGALVTTTATAAV